MINLVLSIILLMINTLIKNNKTGAFRDLQDRTSHYNKILNARSPVSQQYHWSPFKSHFSNLNCKKAHTDQRGRIMENRRLITSLIDIEKNYNIYGKSKTKKKRLAKSLRNQFEEHSKLTKISIDNFTLFKRINNSSSDIGSSSSWRKREDYNKKLHSMLKSPIEAALQLDQQYYRTFSKLRRKKKQKKISYEDILRRRSLKINSTKEGLVEFKEFKESKGSQFISSNSQELLANTPSPTKKRTRRKIYSKVKYSSERQPQNTNSINIDPQ